jgi:hypothetical protein
VLNTVLAGKRSTIVALSELLALGLVVTCVYTTHGDLTLALYGALSDVISQLFHGIDAAKS